MNSIFSRSKRNNLTQYPDFQSLTHSAKRIRYLTKVNLDILGYQTFTYADLVKLTKKYERIFALNEIFNRKQQSMFSELRNIKTNSLLPFLYSKLDMASYLNRRRIQQFTVVLREMILLLNWRPMWPDEVPRIYNLHCRIVDEIQATTLSSSVCSNTYPNIFLQESELNFEAIIKLFSHRKSEKKILNTILKLLNTSRMQRWSNENNYSSSSLNVLNTLTFNIANINNCVFNTNDQINTIDATSSLIPRKHNAQKRLQGHVATNSVYQTKIKISNILLEFERIVLSTFYGKQNQSGRQNDDAAFNSLWTYISTLLDHVILWWNEAPLSCYQLSQVGAIRDWILLDGLGESQEPVRSSLKALCETLTTHISNINWDRMFRIILVVSLQTIDMHIHARNSGTNQIKCREVGKAFCDLFWHLRAAGDKFLSTAGVTSVEEAIAEQISVLHRIDHTAHAMRIWVVEESKLHTSHWSIDVVLNILYIDVKLCLDNLSNFEPQERIIQQPEVLLAVCISLRAKLLLEIKVNIAKLANTVDECTDILSSVCRSLCLAHFSLCFPPRQYWQQNKVSELGCSYVTFVMDRIFLPTLEATRDINIMEMILKLICEAWIDYIYSQKIKFTSCGALALLNHLNELRVWITNITFLPKSDIEYLTSHEVLRMCKGVGKLLAHKPKEMIYIAHSPRFTEPSLKKASACETRLPSEMFVSNQSRWLKLQTSSGIKFY